MRRRVEVGTEEQGMLALTVLQPFATAIMSTDPRAKRNENRSWRRDWPAAGTWVAIHAGKGAYVKSPTDWTRLLDHLTEQTGWDAWRGGTTGLRQYPRGALLGVARFDGCVLVEERPDDPWAVGPWCHVIGEVRPLPAPILGVNGALGFWRVPDQHLAPLRALVAG